MFFGTDWTTGDVLSLLIGVINLAFLLGRVTTDLRSIDRRVIRIEKWIDGKPWG